MTDEPVTLAILPIQTGQLGLLVMHLCHHHRWKLGRDETDKQCRRSRRLQCACRYRGCSRKNFMVVWYRRDYHADRPVDVTDQIPLGILPACSVGIIAISIRCFVSVDSHSSTLTSRLIGEPSKAKSFRAVDRLHTCCLAAKESSADAGCNRLSGCLSSVVRKRVASVN
jgi:hypothetical protein